MKGNSPARKAEDQNGRGIDSHYPPRDRFSFSFAQHDVGNMNRRTAEHLSWLPIAVHNMTCNHSLLLHSC